MTFSARKIRRYLVAWCWLASALTGAARPCSAADFPSRPVHLIVPFAAGSTADVVARALGQALRERWAEPVVVFNKPGAGGTLGSYEAVRAKADGHTLLIGITSLVLDRALHEKLPYDPMKDLQPITAIASAPMILAVHPSVPARDLQGFVAHVRQHPGTLAYGSTGLGTLSHLMMALLKAEAQLDLVHVLYDGNPKLLNDLLGGHIQATVAIAPAVQPLIQRASLRGLASTGSGPAEHTAGVRTFAEQGYRQIDATAWMGLFSPAGLPAGIEKALAADVQRALGSAQLIEELSRAGFKVAGGNPDEFRRFMHAEFARWSAVVRQSGLQGEAAGAPSKASR